MQWLAHIFQSNPVIPVFLTIGLGFWLGRLKFRSFSLGPVAATLLVGVAIGQLGIKIPDAIRSIFFMLFLFSIAYSVGPQFFRSFRGQGLRQVLFALVEACVCAVVIIIAAKLLGYDTGIALGMYAGSQTSSASLGISSETVRGLAMAASRKEEILDMIPVCYAVTYVFGTAGSAWFLSSIGPMLLGGLAKVKAETLAIEAEMDSGEFHPDPGYINANRPVAFRAYRAESEFFARPRTVEEIEREFREPDYPVFVERLRIRGELREPSPNLKVSRGDVVVLGGRREVMVDETGRIGPEVADPELLSFGAERLPVTVSSAGASGQTLGKLRTQPYMRGVVISGITRNNMSLPLRSKTELHRGDQLVLVGLPGDVAHAVQALGYSDRHTNETDMVFLGLGLGIGCFIGALAIHYKGIPISLSTSGGALLSGLLLGWFRNVRPTFGRIPSPVVWIFDNLGLNMFIAVVGINSGPAFISGIQTVGAGLFFVGVACTLVGLAIDIFIARKIFHFSSPETLGCVAGARCGIASIGAIQDALESSVPAIGYTVTYAVANLILPFASLIVLGFV